MRSKIIYFSPCITTDKTVDFLVVFYTKMIDVNNIISLSMSSLYVSSEKIFRNRYGSLEKCFDYRLLLKQPQPLII